MISPFASTMIFGLPLVIWMGLIAFVSLFPIMILGIGRMRGWPAESYTWHRILSYVAITAGAIHVLFGLSRYFGF